MPKPLNLCLSLIIWGYVLDETILYIETNPETMRLSEDDRTALRLLAVSSLAYKIVDLTLTGGAARHVAEQLGIKNTPTLMCGNQKFEGLEQIERALEKKK